MVLKIIYGPSLTPSNTRMEWRFTRTLYKVHEVLIAGSTKRRRTLSRGLSVFVANYEDISCRFLKTSWTFLLLLGLGDCCRDRGAIFGLRGPNA